MIIESFVIQECELSAMFAAARLLLLTLIRVSGLRYILMSRSYNFFSLLKSPSSYAI